MNANANAKLRQAVDAIDDSDFAPESLNSYGAALTHAAPTEITLDDLEARRNGNRTTYHEDGLHVATIIEQARPKRGEAGLYWWATAHNGGHVRSHFAAEEAILGDLNR